MAISDLQKQYKCVLCMLIVQFAHTVFEYVRTLNPFVWVAYIYSNGGGACIFGSHALNYHQLDVVVQWQIGDKKFQFSMYYKIIEKFIQIWFFFLKFYFEI